MKIDEKIEVMKAYADGKKIECLNRVLGESPSEWSIKASPVWNWADFDYRVAQEKPKLVSDYLLKEVLGERAYIDDDGIIWKKRNDDIDEVVNLYEFVFKHCMRYATRKGKSFYIEWFNSPLQIIKQLEAQAEL